jgi:16S rRNA (adenine1518-N6/adenine1519-N6)-dimethyltransferase
VSTYQVTPKRKFGQNFLVNPDVKQKVFRKVDEILLMYPDYSILEVGPGQGDLTEYLITKDRKIVAIEIDDEAKQVVQGRFDNVPNFTVLLADAMDELTKNINQLFGGKTILISNLPYNIGSRLLVDLAIHAPEMPFLVILQNEVARKPLTQSDFTLMGGWLSMFWDYKYQFRISPGSFYPAPKVYSALVMGLVKQTNSDIKKRIKLLEIFKKLNANPNKTLANNLKNLQWSKNSIDNYFITSGFDLTTRLNWDNYQMILETVYDFAQKIS